MGLLDLCNKYFNTTNLYEILGISEKSTEKEVKKAYHKLSLKVHPDRVEENEKLEATEKFKVLGSIHAILTDENKRAVYDETKSVDDDDYNEIAERDWMVYWRLLFKKITLEDIKAYEKEYAGSQQEREDLKQAYMTGKGNMDYIVDHVQFARTENEPRIREVLNEMIEKGEIPSYRAFTHEPAKKRQRRIAKENREAKEAEDEKNKIGIGSEPNSLELMIRQKQEVRGQQVDSFFENLAAKYGNKKTKTTKRKAATKTGTESKTKRKK
ncbi:dnaJ homolog subfamily C member 9 [Achroia grisella]|uniref:dnaJ homolog subfamily C member 9 n=1 Tax=Achroia grisella TaxID=688607 RepID=UPI0027D32898|nr:dnaJ homolog subfamily C member 9 [Achroia grisella]